VLVFDVVAGALVSANAAGWKAWGLDPGAVAPPIALDAAMPALQRLRQLAGGQGKDDYVLETLTFWTARGLVRLCGQVQAADAASVRVVGRTFPVEGAGARTVNGHAAGERHWPTDIAHAAWLAHELRTPLSAVIAYAEILKDEHFGPLADARYRGYARDIYEGARHALGVVDSMLRTDPARPSVSTLAYTDLDPASVVESCLAVARPLAERAGIDLGARYAPRLPRIVADEVSLKQILLNLLANAVKFARRGDHVTIAVAHDGDGPLLISVADTGPGMGLGGDVGTEPPAGDAGSHGTGLGLGLPLARALAAANGAVVDIESEPGQGTCVTIAFGRDRVVPV
jgi:signal transduction histidine kinase